MFNRFCLAIFFWCCLSSGSLSAQNFLRKYIGGIINDTTESSQPRFLLYPTLAFAPETSWEIGLSSLYIYYAKKDTSNRLSEISGFTFFTLENQYGLWFEHAIYSDKDEWFFLGRIRFQSFPLFYHGIGFDTPAEYLAVVDANQILIRERVLKKVANHFFVGLETDFQRLSSVEFLPAIEGVEIDKPLGSEGSSNIGFGVGLVYDNRHNVLNVRKGFFSELAFLHYDPSWGSSYNFTSVFSDTRWFVPSGEKNVFAAQLLAQFSSENTPFNQLALLGGENIMRGYYLGRFRDRHQVALQAEYRFLPLPLSFSNRFGAAVFAGAGTVYHDMNSLALKKTLVTGGGGIRFLLFPNKDIYTRFDVAFTREGSGFYLFIGEAF